MYRIECNGLQCLPQPLYAEQHIMYVLNALKCIEDITGIGPYACSTEHDQPCTPLCSTIHHWYCALWLQYRALHSLDAVQHITSVVLCGCITEHDQPCIPCMQYNTLLAL